jgi:hypothetical protein
MVSYRLEMVSEVREWLHQLRRTDRTTARLVGQAVTALLDEGPSLGRPLVDRLKGSNLHNLKELRPGSSGASEVLRYASSSYSTRNKTPSYWSPATRQASGQPGTGKRSRKQRNATPPT